MTNVEYAKFLLSDDDSTEQLFSDIEVEELIKDNTEYKSIVAQRVDDTHFKINYKRLDESYSEQFLDVYGNSISATIDKITGEIITDEAQDAIRVNARIVHWNDVLADMYEKIASDFRKLANYSTSINSQSYDDTKSILLRMANAKRPVRGYDL